MTSIAPDSQASTPTGRYRARWVFPVDRPPMEHATVEIDNGQIIDVHGRHDPRASDLGNVAIIPGLVNAHTHLEFSSLERPLGPSKPFAEWIRAVIAWRGERADPVRGVVGRGLAEVTASGTTTVGEIATDGWAPEPFADQTGTTVVFRELLGLSRSRAESQLEIAREHVGSRDGGIIRGLSPHAPYSVHPDLFAGLIELAKSNRVPLAMHLAETQEELELLSQRSGPLVDLFRRMGLWDDAPESLPARPLEYLRMMAELPSVLVIHGNYLDDEELAFVAERPNMTVVYCPRTHAYFQHDPHPWLRLAERGASVALGTDGRASNPDLSLWNELLFLRRRFPDVEPERLLKLGTINGAAALNVDGLTGTISPGQRADLALVRLPLDDSTDPWTLLFHAASRAELFGPARLER